MRRYTKDQLEFLKEGYKTMNVECLTIAFNAKYGTEKTENAIKSALNNHSFTCGRSPKERIVLNRHRVYTPEHARFIAKYYTVYDITELTDRFNRRFNTSKTRQQIKAYIGNNRINSGRTGCFKKGHTPHNKGKKGWDAGGNSAKTRFNRGHRPHNWKPVGSERFSKEGILQRKVTDTGYPPRDWKSVHSLLWEEHRGPIPKGHIIVFKNGDRTDIRIDNLECITLVENMRRNTIHNLPPVLADVCRIRGVLNRHINERTTKDEK